MAWSGGNFTRANPTWVSDAAAGIGIEAARHDTQDNDFTTGINECLNKTGQNGMSGTLSMGSNKISNLAAGTLRNDAAQVGQVQDGDFIWLGTTAGTAAAQTASATPAITAYKTGQVFRFISGFYTAAEAAVTLNVNGIGAKTCVGLGSNTPLNGFLYLQKGIVYEATYNGTNFAISNVTDVGQYSGDAGGPRVRFYKSRAVDASTNTIVQNGDSLGQLDFFGANGSNYTRGAIILAAVDGTPGASNDMPTRLTFNTSPDGTGSPNERMRITSGGRVGIGTGSPGSILSIINNESNSVNTGVFQSNVAGDAATHALIVTKRDNNSTTGQVLIGFLMNSGVTGQGQINANGASQAAFGSFSDERLKENIEDLPSQLVNMLALRPVEFDYKNGDGHQIGFIAQEVEQIYPDLVSEAANGFLTLSGLGKNEARMIKAFQEFAQLTEAKIAALEARIAALEA